MTKLRRRVVQQYDDHKLTLFTVGSFIVVMLSAAAMMGDAARVRDAASCCTAIRRSQADPVYGRKLLRCDAERRRNDRRLRSEAST